MQARRAWLSLHEHFTDIQVALFRTKSSLRQILYLLTKNRLFNKEVKQRRFWVTYAKRMWGIFPFNIPKRYQICAVKAAEDTYQWINS